MYGFIYITTNNLDGKKYIGQKSYSMPNWKRYLGSGIYLKRAIKKYGRENFSREIIEECETREELNEREKYWIKYYDATNSDDFYNIAHGGDGGWVNEGKSKEEIKAMYDNRATNPRLGEKSSSAKLTNNEVEEIIQCLLNREFIQDIAKKYNVSPRTIDDIKNHKTWKHMTENYTFPKIPRGEIISALHKGKKKIDIYKLDGSFVGMYNSAREVERDLDIPYKNVSQVCYGQKRQSHGYICRFHGDAFDKYNTELKTNPKGVIVDIYKINGDFIQTCNSYAEAEKVTGVNDSYISKIAMGKAIQSKGYVFRKHGEPFDKYQIKKEE